MTVHAMIPFRNKLEMTAALAKRLTDADMVHLFDNGSDADMAPLISNLGWRYALYRRPGRTLTEMWNEAWDIADEWGASELAVLNNDITVPVGFLGHLAKALRSDERWWVVSPDTRPQHPETPTGAVVPVAGVGVGRMAGWAFMVKLAARKEGLTHLADRGLQWWYGDNDLAATVASLGHEVGLVEGLRCDHEISATWRDHPELHPVTRVDRDRYMAKWGRET